MKSTRFLLCLCLIVAIVNQLESKEARYHVKLFDKTFVLTPVEDQVMIKFSDDAGAAEIKDALESLDLREIQKPNMQDKFGVYLIPPSRDTETLKARLRTNVLVRSFDHPAVDHEGYTKYFVPDELTVRFNDDVPEGRQLEIIHELGCEVSRVQWTPGYYTLSYPDDKDLFQLVRVFMERVEVKFSDLLFTPNDTNFSSQWALKNTGQYGGTPGADIQATLAWDQEMGDEMVIIVDIDTGIDLDHPDLVSNILPRDGEDWDFASGDGSPDDDSGHGTCTAGIAAAVTDNGIGIAGVAPGVRIMPLRINLTSGYNQNRADAINYAVSRRPEFAGMVISCSWRMSSGDFTAVEDACQNAYDNDVVIMFATGNDNSTINYPAKYPTTIAVGASSQCDERKSYSSCDGEYYWGSNYGEEIDVVAPGVNIYTTDMSGWQGYSSGDYYSSFNGTSAACPHAAGVAALILSANPYLTNHMVRTLLHISSEDEVGPPSEDTPGWDIYMGFGRVNANRAVIATLAPLDMSVQVTPQDTVVAQGSELVFTVDLENLSAEQALFEGWVDIILPNGVPVPGNPYIGPIELLFDPGETISRTLSLTVPVDAPVVSGFQLLARVGYNPEVVAAEDGFYFDIVSSR
jgi:hypothetical protein